MDNIARHILGLPGWAALVIVFAVPLLESSAFVGFVFPGEIAVLLGGVLAFQHRVGLPAVLAAAIAGAILGDTIGYWVGRRYGRRLRPWCSSCLSAPRRSTWARIGSPTSWPATPSAPPGWQCSRHCTAARGVSRAPVRRRVVMGPHRPADRLTH